MTLPRITDPNEILVLEMEETALFESDVRPEPDPEWEDVDPEGHVHRWKFLNPTIAATDPDGASPSLPTLRYTADDGGAHYQCKQCGWPVQPGKRAKGTGRFQRPRRVYRLNGGVVDEKVAKLAFGIIQGLNSGNVPPMSRVSAEGLPAAHVVGDDKR